MLTRGKGSNIKQTLNNMNLPDVIVQQKRRELVSVAQAVIDGVLNPIEGCRIIDSLRFSVKDPENKVFLPIRGVDSETDIFPLGEVRLQFTSDYLEKMDSELSKYLAVAGKDIAAACVNIVREFS